MSMRRVRSMSNPASSSFYAPISSTMCGSCFSPASARLTTRRPAWASSARTTPIRSRRVLTSSSTTRLSTPFIGAGALGMIVDEFNGDNFDHTGLGFIGGGYLAGWNTNGRPIETHRTPQGTPRWGAKWKRAVADNYLKSFSISTHGAVMSHRANALDLDPTYRDMFGRPLMRMTFDFTDNEHRMSDYLTDRATEIAKAMRPREMKVNKRSGAYSIVP